VPDKQSPTAQTTTAVDASKPCTGVARQSVGRRQHERPGHSTAAFMSAIDAPEMIRLNRALSVWGTAEFEAVLKRELQLLGAGRLPLQQGLSASSVALDNSIDVMVKRVADDTGAIRVKAGIFYAGIVAGCSCADDPTPLSENTEYCEVEVVIDKATAVASITLLAE